MNVLYVSDLDGTLLNNQQKLDDEAVNILNQLIEQGNHFTVATARSIESVREILKDVHLKLPIILINGVFVYDPIQSQNIQSKYLPVSLAS